MIRGIMVLLTALVSLALNSGAMDLRPGIPNHTQVVNGVNGQDITPNSVTATTSLTVPGQVLVSSGARVSALGVGTDIPASGVAIGNTYPLYLQENSALTGKSGIRTGGGGSFVVEGSSILYLENDNAGNVDIAGGGGQTIVHGQSSFNGSVGILTSSPATTLDVNGSAQFGSGATKSTFTATGSLSIPANTNVNLNTGVATSFVRYRTTGSQPGVDVQGDANGPASFANGGLAIGSYGGGGAIPSNSLIVSGSVGIGTASPGTKLHMSSGTLTVDGTGAGFNLTSVTTGGAVCFNSSHNLSKCTTAVDASGNCTCP